MMDESDRQLYIALFSPMDLRTSPRTNGEGISRFTYRNIKKQVERIDGYRDAVRLSNRKSALSPRRLIVPTTSPPVRPRFI